MIGEQSPLCNLYNYNMYIDSPQTIYVINLVEVRGWKDGKEQFLG